MIKSRSTIILYIYCDRVSRFEFFIIFFYIGTMCLWSFYYNSPFASMQHGWSEVAAICIYIVNILLTMCKETDKANILRVCYLCVYENSYFVCVLGLPNYRYLKMKISEEITLSGFLRFPCFNMLKDSQRYWHILVTLSIIGGCRMLNVC